MSAPCSTLLAAMQPSTCLEVLQLMGELRGGAQGMPVLE